MKPVLKESTAVLFLSPHSQTVGIERHHLRLLGALFVDVAVEQVAQVLGNLIAKLNAHADVGNAAEQRFKHRLGLVAVAVGRKVSEDSSELIARDKCAAGTNHDVVAHW